MKPTLTLSFACAVAPSAPTKSALAKKRPICLTILDIDSSLIDRSLTYPRSNFYQSVVPHLELNEFAKQPGYRVNDPMVARLSFSGDAPRLWSGARPPPSATSTAPVTNDASSEARKGQHAAISDGCAMRPGAMRFVVASSSASVVEMLLVSGYQLRAIIQRGGQERPSTSPVEIAFVGAFFTGISDPGKRQTKIADPEFSQAFELISAAASNASSARVE
jgi:hypothetical protein